jgi:hypothetical protein
MHKNATKCNKTQGKWCINRHGASKIIDTFETYQGPTIYYSKQNKRKLKGKIKTLQEKHIAYEAIKI